MVPAGLQAFGFAPAPPLRENVTDLALKQDRTQRDTAMVWARISDSNQDRCVYHGRYAVFVQGLAGASVCPAARQRSHQRRILQTPCMANRILRFLPAPCDKETPALFPIAMFRRTHASAGYSHGGPPIVVGLHPGHRSDKDSGSTLQ